MYSNTPKRTEEYVQEFLEIYKNDIGFRELFCDQ